MKPLEIIKYVSGTDYLADSFHHENEVLRQETGQDLNLPTDASPRVAAEIYSERVKTAIVYPFVLLSRLSGIDAARRLIAHRRAQ